MQLVVFTLQEQHYALPLAAVERVVRAAATTPLPGAPPVVLGVLDIAGEVLPVLSLRRRFGLPARAEPAVSDHFVIAHTGRRPVVLVVDELVGVVERSDLAFTAASRIAPGMRQIAAAATLEGRLVLIEDLAQCLTAAEAEALDTALAGAEPHDAW